MRVGHSDVVGCIRRVAFRVRTRFLHGVGDYETAAVTLVSRLFGDTVEVHFACRTAVHLSALLPVENGRDTEFVQFDIRIESQTKIRRNAADNIILAHLRKSVGVYYDLSGTVALVRAAIYDGEFLTDTGTHLWSDETAQIDAFHARSQFVHVVVNLREVESEVELEVAVVHRRYAQRDFVSVGVNLTTVHNHAVITRRTAQGHFKYLVFHVLARIGVVQGEQAVEERQVGTDFVRFRVLRFQVGVVHLIIRYIRHRTVERIRNRRAVEESAAVSRGVVVTFHVVARHTYFGIRST